MVIAVETVVPHGSDRGPGFDLVLDGQFDDGSGTGMGGGGGRAGYGGGCSGSCTASGACRCVLVVMVGSDDHFRCGLYVLLVLLLLDLLLADGDGPFAEQPIVLRPGGTL